MGNIPGGKGNGVLQAGREKCPTQDHCTQNSQQGSWMLPEVFVRKYFFMVSKSPFFPEIGAGQRQCREFLSKTTVLIRHPQSYFDYFLPPVLVLQEKICFFLLFIRKSCIYFLYCRGKAQSLYAFRVTSLHLISSGGPKLISCLKQIVWNHIESITLKPQGFRKFYLFIFRTFCLLGGQTIPVLLGACS